MKEKTNVFELEDKELEQLKEKYDHLNLTVMQIYDAAIMLAKGPIDRLVCFAYDYQGTPLKYLSEKGQEAAVEAARLQLEKLPLPPDRVFKQEGSEEIAIVVEFQPPFLLELKVGEIEEFLMILTRFQEYLDQIEIFDVQISDAPFYDMALVVSDRVSKFKELFLD
jgi:predicted metalloenzyme YecM